MVKYRLQARIQNLPFLFFNLESIKFYFLLKFKILFKSVKFVQNKGVLHLDFISILVELFYSTP